MSYQIFPSEDRKYIVLKHQGEINGEIAMVRVQEAHRLGTELGIAQYLADLTEARNVDSVSKSFKYAYKDAKNSPETNLNMRVSMLVSPEDHTHDFVETVLRNAGHNVTLFRDRALAIKHLLK
jgi:hypothetical protein